MFPFATIKELEALLNTSAISVEELLKFYLKRFAMHDTQLGTALEVFDADSILKEWRKSKHPLNGIPGLIKDNICQIGRTTSCASKILENFVATYDATAIKRLKDAGALLIGRANMDEFAMGSSTETSAFKKTVNPWDYSRVPGGSSGGSIAAVAAGLIPWALGSETGGSVRQPAAFCGITGLKPTYGLISRYGVVAYASSLDQIGIAARSAYDVARVLSVIAGVDEHDATTLPQGAHDYTAALTGKLPHGLKIGVVTNAVEAEGIHTEVAHALQEAITQFTTLGATTSALELTSMEYGAAIYFILSRAEAASNLARFDGVRYGHRASGPKNLLDLYERSRAEGFGQEVKARIMVGNYVLSVGHASDFYVKAVEAQKVMRHDFEQALKEVDILIAPTTPCTAFKFGAFDDNKLQMDLQDYFTCPANIVGMPALSIPCGFDKHGLPIGIQLIAEHGKEALLLQVADAYQHETEWHTRYPQQLS